MSELIDHIIDVEAIEKEKKELEAILQSLQKDVSGFSSNLKDLDKSTRGAQSVKELTENSKKLNDVIVNSSKTVEKMTATQKALISTEEKLKTVQSEEYKELLKAQQALKDESELIKLNTQLQNENLGTLERATLENKKYEIEKKKLNLETDEGIAQLRKLNELQEENLAITKASMNSDQQRTAGIGQYKNQIGELVQQFKNGEIGSKELAKSVMQLGKQMLIAFVTNPILLTIGAIVGVIATLVQAFKRSEEASNKLKVVTGALSGVFGGFMNALKPVVNFIADTVIKTFEGLGNIAEKATGLVSKGLRALGFDKAAEGVDKMTASVKENAKSGAELAKMQNEQTKNERELSRIQFEYLKEQEKFRQVRDDITRSTAERIKANDDLGASLLKQAEVEGKILKQALVIAQERAKIQGETPENLDAIAEAKANIADLEERINGFQSEQLVNAVGIRKEAEDAAKAQKDLQNSTFETAKSNSKLSEEIAKQEKELDDWLTNEEIENNEQLSKDAEAQINFLIGESQREYERKKQILRKKYKSDEEYNKAVFELDKQYSQAAIDKLSNELTNFKGTEEQKFAIKEELAQAQMNLDTMVFENSQNLAEKTKELNQAIFNAGMELFGALGDFQAQESEKRLAEIEAENEKSNEYFEGRQANLDNAIMSDASRAEAQRKLDEDKAKREKELADKKHKEEVRAAKWEKAQALVSAAVNTATSIIKTGAEMGYPLAIPFQIIAGLIGAVQIATIAGKQIPAYEKGGITKGEPFSLWGEKRPEIAELPSGQFLYAEKPTVSKFDAGTKIYKSVEDFEKSIMQKGARSFEFDYDKMAEKMPVSSFLFDSNGIHNHFTRQGDRRASINRRTKLN